MENEKLAIQLMRERLSVLEDHKRETTVELARLKSSNRELQQEVVKLSHRVDKESQVFQGLRNVIARIQKRVFGEEG